MPETAQVRLQFCDYPSLLEEIRKRPQMYLGGEERNLRLLGAFLDGFKTAEWFHNLPEAQHMGGFDWESYEKWVKHKYNTKRLSANSMPLALYVSDSEAAAFDLWFSWYDEYSESERA
jgi:hypothetical protein